MQFFLFVLLKSTLFYACKYIVYKEVCLINFKGIVWDVKQGSASPWAIPIIVDLPCSLECG